MATIKHITLKEFADFHEVKTTLIHDFAEFGLIELEEVEQQQCIVPKDINKCESAVRLYRDLSVNKEGIEIILDMREKHETIQKELMLLRHKIRKYEEQLSQLFSEDFF